MFACNLDKSVKVDITAPTGPTGSIGIRGYDGNSSRWKANTQGITPLTGQFHINTIGNAIVINQFDSNTNDMLSWLQDTKVGDIITIREVDNPAMVGYFSLVSLFSFLLPNVWQATISYISGPITGIVPATVPLFHYIGFVPIGPTGPTGPTGTQGPTGIQGPTGPTRAMATYSFATTRFTVSTDISGSLPNPYPGGIDPWGFAARGFARWNGPAAGAWPSTAACNIPNLFTLLPDINVMFGTFVGLNSTGWFNNWFINTNDSSAICTAGDCRIVIQDYNGNLSATNHGIRFIGPDTGNAELTATTGFNLCPGNWQTLKNQPYQNGIYPLGPTTWYDANDCGYGYASDFANQIPAANVVALCVGTTANAAAGWFPACENYVTAPKTNASGYIVGLSITGMSNAISFGSLPWAPAGDPLDDYCYVKIRFVKGEFTNTLAGSGNCSLSRDIDPIDIIKVTRRSITCPSCPSGTGTAITGAGPHQSDWVTNWGPADYIPITDVTYFRLQTLAYVKAWNNVAGSSSYENPEVGFVPNRFKIGVRLYILWDQ